MEYIFYAILLGWFLGQCLATILMLQGERIYNAIYFRIWPEKHKDPSPEFVKGLTEFQRATRTVGI